MSECNRDCDCVGPCKMGIENADTRMKRLARRIDVQLSDHAVSGEAYALHPDDWAIIRAAIPTRILGDRHE